MQNLDNFATTPNLFSGHREIMKSIKITRQKYIINQAICSNLFFLIPCFFIFSSKKKKSFTFHRSYKQRCFSKNYQNFLEKKFI